MSWKKRLCIYMQNSIESYKVGWNKKGDVMIKRHTHLLNEHSAEKKRAKLIQQLQRSVKAVDANANGTSGYTIKEGKNAGKVLNHIRNNPKKL